MRQQSCGIVCVCVCVWSLWTVTSPHPPYNVTVRTAARSAKVTWLPAYDLGHPQHYVLWSVFFSAHLFASMHFPREPCRFYVLSELRAFALLNLMCMSSHVIHAVWRIWKFSNREVGIRLEQNTVMVTVMVLWRTNTYKDC